MSPISWKELRARKQNAARRGEETARAYGFESWPVDPLVILKAEKKLILASGDDYRDTFDGRLSYVGPRFVLCYNTKYNQWPHQGELHPKVRFTLGHELGHYFMDSHRTYLVNHKKPHGSFTEFQSNSVVEQEADSFSSGLLMPSYLLSSHINQNIDPTLDHVREMASKFDVSFTALLVRWVQLSHFPCAALCVRKNRIQWGFASDPFKTAGLYRARTGQATIGQDAGKFTEVDPTFSKFRVGQGSGIAKNWLDWQGRRISVNEFYMAIPYSKCLMVFAVADEDDLPQRWDD